MAKGLKDRTAPRMLTGLFVVSCAVTVSACSSTADPVPPSTQPSASPSASPSPTGPSAFAMTNGRIDVAELPATLLADSGSISVTTGDDGTTAITAQSIAKRAQAPWTLTVAVTNQGRAAGGTLVAQGRTWNVTPGSGQVSINRDTATVSIISTGAITLTGVDTPRVNTPMVISLAGTGTAAAPQ